MVGPSEILEHDNEKVDLITVCQAIHWFDIPKVEIKKIWKVVLDPFIRSLLVSSRKGSFKNYLDNKRWVGGQKIVKCPCGS